MNQNIIRRAAEIVEKNTVQGGEFSGQHCVLSLIDTEGFPTASVITPSRAAGINWITFGAEIGANKAKRIANCNRASVCFSTVEHCVNLVGEIEIITSDDVKHEMWYDGLKMHFTGPDDPHYCVLRFVTKRYKLFIDYRDVAGTL